MARCSKWGIGLAIFSLVANVGIAQIEQGQSYSQAHGRSSGDGRDPSGNQRHPTAHPEAEMERTCFEGVTEKDKQLYQEYQAKIADLNGLKSEASSSSYSKAVDRIVEEYQFKFSPASLQTFVADSRGTQILELAKELSSNSSLSEAYQGFEKSVEQHQRNREIYSGKGFFSGEGILSRSTGGADKRFEKSANDLNDSFLSLIRTMKSSKLPSFTIKQLEKSLLTLMRTEARLDTSSAEKISDRYHRGIAAAKLTRDVSAGSALLVGSILLGGATFSAGTAVLGTTGSKAAMLLTASAVAGASGAVGGGGYGLVRGSIASVSRALLNDQEFLCSLAADQAENSSQTYKDALKFAAFGGLAGSAFGFGMAFGGAVATTTIGLGTTLTTAGVGMSVWGATENGIKAKEFYEKALVAAENGNENLAREYLEASRYAAVEAGLSSVDTLLAGVATKKSFDGFVKALRASPKGLAKMLPEKIPRKEMERFLHPNEANPDNRISKQFRKGVEYAENNYQHVTRNGNGAVVFHGSSSSSLLAFTFNKKMGGLRPASSFGNRTGNATFTGELRAGRDNSVVSGVKISDLDVAVEYSRKASSEFNVAPSAIRQEVQSLKQEISGYHAKGETGKAKYFERQLEFLEARSAALESLPARDLKLVEESFPVIFGLKPNSARKFHTGKMDQNNNALGGGIEIQLEGGADFSEISSVFVPKNKVRHVQSMLRDQGFGDTIVVSEIEPILSATP